MAHLIARTDGNWTAAATWGVCDATSLLDSQAGNAVLTTSFVSSSAFTPGAITVDGVAVKVASRSATPSGTMSVRLAQAGVEVAGTTVTINVADLPLNAVAATSLFTGCSIGWVFFAFAAPVTLAAATAYTLQATTSVATQVNLFRDATASNWARLLRTTTTAAPAAGDSMFVIPAWTAAATRTTPTVTMNETATTDYGNADLARASIGIGDGCVLTWAVAAATNYRLRVSGILAVWVGGTYRMGTAVAPVPGDSTAELQFDNAADGNFGWISYGEFTTHGAPRTAGLAVTHCLLNTDEAIGQTVLGVDRDTGWRAGDRIAIAGTTRTVSQAEARVLAANATATTLEVTVALAIAHGGTAPVQAEVVNLTRNVRIVSVTAGLAGYGKAIVGSVSMTWTEARYLGGNVTGKIAPVQIGPLLAGAVAARYCAFSDTESTFVEVEAAGALPAIDLTGTVCFGGAAAGTAMIALSGGDTAITFTATDLVLIGSGVATAGINVFRTCVLAWANVRVCNVADAGVTVSPSGLRLARGTIAGLYVHGCSSGTVIGASADLNINGGALWRNNAQGIAIDAIMFRLTVRAVLIFGNANINVLWEGGDENRFIDCTIAGDTSFASATGVRVSNNVATSLAFHGCALSPTSGIFVPHTRDFDAPGSSGNSRYSLLLNNTTCLAATKFDTTFLASYPGSEIREQRVGGVTDVHQTWFFGRGTVAVSAAVTRSSPRAQELSPDATAVLALRSGPKRFLVRSGKRLTFTAYVRKNGTYNGAAARLVLLANAAVGVLDDTVLDTHTAAADVWEGLTGQSPIALEDGVMEVRVECDGTAGSIYVDDWSALST